MLALISARRRISGTLLDHFYLSINRVNIAWDG
jgi:hypothetical protein